MNNEFELLMGARSIHSSIIAADEVKLQQIFNLTPLSKALDE